MNLLISAKDLRERLDDGKTVVVDCRFNLMDPKAGRAAWQAGHIPGAYYADLDRDLAAPRRPDSGRHPLPDPEQFAVLLGSWGLTPETLVVAYDDVGGAVAGRLWWLLHWVGHERVVLLDGGLPAWTAAGCEVDAREPQPGSGSYPVKPGSLAVMTSAEVEQGLSDDLLLLVDARDAGRFAGKAEPIDTRAGHIPGSFNRPFQQNLTADGSFRPPEELRAEFEELLACGPKGALAFSCGSGVTACHNLFALRLAGIHVPASLYVGSWSEWITDPGRAVGALED